MEEETERLKDERCDTGEMQLMTCSPRPGETAQPGPARLSVGCCLWMLIKYCERPRQLALGQLGGVGACRQVKGGHVIRLGNTCASCASSPPSVTTAVSCSIVLAAPGTFSCPHQIELK